MCLAAIFGIKNMVWLPVKSCEWECGLQFGIQFAELLISSEDIGRRFDIFPGNFQYEYVMPFRRVPFLEPINNNICYSPVRF